MPKYSIKIERTQRGKVLGVKELEIEPHYKPKLGEGRALLCDPPIYETIIEIETI